MGFDPRNDFQKGSPTRVLANKIFSVSRLVDLRIGFWPQKRSPQVVTRRSRMIHVQVYRSGSTRSVFILNYPQHSGSYYSDQFR